MTKLKTGLKNIANEVPLEKEIGDIAGISIKNRHIVNINFDNQYVINVAPIFEGAKPWFKVPDLTVITGQTGVGKTNLLNYLYSRLNSTINCVKIDIKGYSSSNNHSYGNFSSLLNNSYISEDTTESLRDEFIDDIKSFYLNAEKLPERREADKAFFLFIIQNLKAEGITLDLLNKDPNAWANRVEECIILCINYATQSFRVETPLEILTSLCVLHCERKDALFIVYKKRFYENKDLESFTKHFCSKNLIPYSIDSYIKFKESIKSSSDLITFLEDYIIQVLGNSPLDEINHILKKYDLNYHLEYDKHNGQKVITLTRLDTKKEIRIEALSSGEELVLTMLVLQYYYKQLEYCFPRDESIQVSTKIDLLLLDEPDKHLDPKWCEKLFRIIDEVFVRSYGIQVMLTTHRTDTIALSPQSSIYLMDKDSSGVVSINPCHKLRAMLNMTRNTRQHTNFHVKVYTESFNDAKFYSGIYKYLMNKSDEIRETNITKETGRDKERFNWYSTLYQNGKEYFGEKVGRVLSRRYQLDFYSACEDKDGGGGGHAAVIQEVTRETRAHENIAQRDQTFNVVSKKRNFRFANLCEYNLSLPFGIIDYDYGSGLKFRNEAAIKNNFLREKILVLDRRHSVENFIFDPFIVCSLLDNKSIGKIINPDLKSACNSLHNKLMLIKEGKTVSPFTEHLDYMVAMLKIMDTKALINNVLPKWLKDQQDHPDVIRKTSMLIPNEWLVERVVPSNWYMSIFRDQEYTTNKKVLLPNNQIMEVGYIRAFIEIRGHDLAFKEKPDKNFYEGIKNDLIDKLLLCDDSLCLPLDLIEIFMNLNERARTQANNIIKQPNNIIH